MLALGDAAMTVKTAGDLVLQTVMDPLLLNSDTYHQGGTSRYNAHMSGYTDRTFLELLSVGGSVSLTNQGRFLSKQLDVSVSTYNPDVDYSLIGVFATNLYPSVTRIAALNGSVINQDRMFTSPGANPELRILAERDVVLGEITMSRATSAMMPKSAAAVRRRQQRLAATARRIDAQGFPVRRGERLHGPAAQSARQLPQHWRCIAQLS